MASALSATLSALKAVPAAMQMMKAARSAMPIVRSASPASMKALGNSLGKHVEHALQGGASGGKQTSPLSQMFSSLSRLAPHVGAMAGKSALGPAMKQGMQAARELSKMGAHARTGSGKETQPEASGKAGRKSGGIEFRVGPVQKNWEHATAENGFHEIGRSRTSSGKSGSGPRVRFMLGPVEKNWEKATPENGFREIGRSRSSSSKSGSGPRVRFMLGPIEKNWEQAAKPFKRRSGGDHLSGGLHNKWAQDAEAFMKAANAEQSSGGQTRGRSNSDPGPGAQRFTALSDASQGLSGATQSRQRANAFAGTSRKQGGGFPVLSLHIGFGARQRGNGENASPRMSLHISFNASGMGPSQHPRGGAQSTRRRANSF